MTWKRYLSRGTGPGTGHRIASANGWSFEIWTVGELD
jgi:hypothetical protein